MPIFTSVCGTHPDNNPWTFSSPRLWSPFFRACYVWVSGCKMLLKLIFIYISKKKLLCSCRVCCFSCASHFVFVGLACNCDKLAFTSRKFFIMDTFLYDINSVIQKQGRIKQLTGVSASKMCLKSSQNIIAVVVGLLNQ